MIVKRVAKLAALGLVLALAAGFGRVASAETTLRVVMRDSPKRPCGGASPSWAMLAVASARARVASPTAVIRDRDKAGSVLLGASAGMAPRGCR